MPEPLKNLYNKELISSLSSGLKAVYGQFNHKQFQESIFSDDWSRKELKERMKHISVTLQKYLPGNYKDAIEILKSVSSNFNGFEYMFFPGYVELYGLNEYEESIKALEHFTTYSSSEFAVRPFIQKYNSRMMDQMSRWAESSNHHVRRLASEGCRPRLPWAMSLPEFKKDPGLILKILKKLKNDESEYVRRSVANNLNDISKDNPDIVVELAGRWMGKSTYTDKLVKHACRSLLKKAHPEILDIFGLVEPNHLSVDDFRIQESVNVGDSLSFLFTLTTQQGRLGKLRIEYAIDFMKKDGRLSRKLFKISESNCPDQKKTIRKEHSFRIISTRKYYKGVHGFALIVNGKELLNSNFELTWQ